MKVTNNGQEQFQREAMQPQGQRCEGGGKQGRDAAEGAGNRKKRGKSAHAVERAAGGRGMDTRLMA